MCCVDCVVWAVFPAQAYDEVMDCSARNKHTLEILQYSAFTVCLDHEQPKDIEAVRSAVVMERPHDCPALAVCTHALHTPCYPIPSIPRATPYPSYPVLPIALHTPCYPMPFIPRATPCPPDPVLPMQSHCRRPTSGCTSFGCFRCFSSPCFSFPCTPHEGLYLRSPIVVCAGCTGVARLLARRRRQPLV